MEEERLVMGGRRGRRWRGGWREETAKLRENRKEDREKRKKEGVIEEGNEKLI